MVLYVFGTVYIFASDWELSISTSFNVIVSAINDAPITSEIDATIDEGGSITISLDIEDVDSDNLTYTVSGGNQITSIVSGREVNFNCPDNYNGSESFIATVNDGELETSRSFLVTVNAVNDIPTIVSTCSDTFNNYEENDGWQCLVVVEDVDNDQLIFDLTSEPENMTVNNFGVIEWLPVPQDNNLISHTISINPK